MSNYVVGESSDLFDPVTGAWVGVLDKQGREQTILSPAQSAAIAAAGGGGVLAVVGNAPTMNWTSPALPTSASIAAAVQFIKATGKPGTVILDSIPYAITESIPLEHGVSFAGVPARFAFGADVPENSMTFTSGTRFNVSAGVTPFAWNNTDKGVDEVNIASFALVGCKFYGIYFDGGARCISFGALRAMGFLFCEFDELYGFNQTSQFSFDFNNFQYSRFGSIMSRNDLDSVSGGIRYSSRLSATLLPGDSIIYGRQWVQTYKYKNRGIVFEATGPSGCILNDIKVSGELHCNRYANPSTIATVSLTATSGNVNFSVSAIDIAKLAVGMPVVFAATAPTAFATSTAFYITALDGVGNTLQLSEAPYSAAITPTSSAAYAASFAGFPAIEFLANSGCAFSNSDFGLLNPASTYGAVAMGVAKWRNCSGFLATISNSPTATTLALRDVDGSLVHNGLNYVTQDQSGLAGNVGVKNNSNGPLLYSGGSFTLNSQHANRAMRYSGTADITITVPASLPQGFDFSVFPTGATGIITFVASGSTLWTKVGLRTNGQYAKVLLENVATLRYSVSGDTQV